MPAWMNLSILANKFSSEIMKDIVSQFFCNNCDLISKIRIHILIFQKNFDTGLTKMLSLFVNHYKIQINVLIIILSNLIFKNRKQISKFTLHFFRFLFQCVQKHFSQRNGFFLCILRQIEVSINFIDIKFGHFIRFFVEVNNLIY